MLTSVKPTVIADVPTIDPELAWTVAVPVRTPDTTPFELPVVPTVAEPLGLLVVTAQFTDPVTFLVELSS
jgi:hypothetical protein